MSEARKLEYDSNVTPMGTGKEPSSSWILFLGLVHMALGAIAIFMPFAATVAFQILFGSLFIASGVMQMFQIFKVEGVNDKLLAFLTATLYLIAGSMLLYYLVPGMFALTIVLGSFYLVVGGVRFAQIFRCRGDQRFWMTLSSVLALSLGGIIVLGLPETAFWVIGLLIGVDLLLMGIGLLAWSAEIRAEDELKEAH